MNDFWKSINNDDQEQDGNQERRSLGDFDRPEANLPAVPSFETEDAIIDEPSPAVSSSAASLGQVEEADLVDPNQTNAQDPAVSVGKTKRKAGPWIISFIIAGVIILALITISSGSNKKANEASTPQPPVTPVNPDPVNPDPVSPEPVKPEPVKPEPVKPESDPSDGGSGGATSELDKQRAIAEKNLDKAEAWVKAADHPADGKTGVLRDNAKQMAARIRKETGLNVTAGTADKPGQIRLMLSRKVGLCIFTARLNREGMIAYRRVQIYKTGLKG